MALIIFAAPSAAALQQVPTCPAVPLSVTDPGTFEHRWAGYIATVCTIEGSTSGEEEVWIGEDGGRIRHRNPSNGLWTYQPVPFNVRGIIRKIHFQADRAKGWAVSSDGWVVHTVNGGGTWTTLARMSGSFGVDEWEDFYDIWMHPDGDFGILLGFRGIWTTVDGGACWERSEFYDAQDQLLGQQEFMADPIELYGLAVQIDVDQTACGTLNPVFDFLGLAVSEPGYIFRSLDHGLTWKIVYEVHLDLGVTDRPCLDAAVLAEAPFELWGVAIRNHPTDAPFAVVVGGVGVQCGLILASKDNGCSWTREKHECEGDPNLDCDDNDDYEPWGGPPTQEYKSHRHKEEKLLYDVAAFDDADVAVAVGYNGQHLFRGLTQDNPPVPVWRDRSEMGDIRDAPDHVVIYPFWSVAVVQATSSARAWSSGHGGHLRVTEDAGDTWDHELLGEPFRTMAAYLRPVSGEEDRGWLISQGYRIVWTIDGGKSWSEVEPFMFPLCELHDITFAGDNGVVVGCSPNEPGNLDGPKIFYTDEFDTDDWDETPRNNIGYASDAYRDRYWAKGHLRSVAWAGDTNNERFWAAGRQGLVLGTANAGANWTQLELSQSLSDPLKFEINSVAATGDTHVVFVGSYQNVAMAWRYDRTNPMLPFWEQLSVPSGISVLTDVVIHSSGTYAVGQRNVGGGAVEGVVLKYVSTAFVTLDGPYHPDGTPDCTEGGTGLLGQNVKTLTRLAFDPGDNLWIAGRCGKVWELPDSSSTWVEHKTQTGADIRSMQFLSADRGYFNGYSGEILQALVRLNR